MDRWAICELAPDPASVSDARRFTNARLLEWGAEEVADAAVLLVSETVTNAVLHAGTALTLRLELRDGVVRVEVGDGSQRLPVRRHFSPDAGTGRGLMLIDALASRWGTSETGDGKVVWFELAPGPSDPPRGDRLREAGVATGEPQFAPPPAFEGLHRGAGPADRPRALAATGARA